MYPHLPPAMYIRLSLIALALTLSACTPKAVAPTESHPVIQPTEALPIEVTFPQPGDMLNGQVTITGKARGTWYFEASFPVILLDANGNQILALPVQADGEWMTTDWVPFHTEITIPQDIGVTGTLVLKKDNPSGLPEHEAEIRIPVRFK